MEIRHLRHFVALAEEQSFTRAAARELIVQSGLSSSIRALEKDVGALLFLRGTRPVRLTAEGEALVPAARRVLQATEEAAQVVRDVRGALAGRLRIGALQTSASVCPFSSMVVGFAEAHPGLDISVRQLHAVEILTMLVSGELDCAITSALPGRTAGLRVFPLDTVPLWLACPAQHPLASAADVALSDLAGAAFVETPSGSATRILADDAFAAAGLVRRIACEVSDWSAVLDLVAAGMGVALVPEDYGPRRPVDGLAVHYVPLTRPRLERRFDVVLPDGHAASPAARRFAEHVVRANRGHRAEAACAVPHQPPRPAVGPGAPR